MYCPLPCCQLVRVSWIGCPGIAVEEWARVVEAHDEIKRITGDALEGVDLALQRRLAVRVRFVDDATGQSGDLDVLTDAYPDEGPLRDAWIHNVRNLVARQNGLRPDAVTLAVVSVRDEDDDTASPVAASRYAP